METLVFPSRLKWKLCSCSHSSFFPSQPALLRNLKIVSRIFFILWVSISFGGEKIARFHVEEKVRPLTHIPQDSTFILEIEDPHSSLLRYIIQRKDMNMNGSPSAASLRTNKQ